MSKIYFGDVVDTVRTTAELKLLIDEVRENIFATIDLYFREYTPFGSFYDGDDSFGYRNTHSVRLSRVVEKIKHAYTKIFPNSTYLDDLKLDESRGEITSNDFKRYFSALFNFMSEFEYLEFGEKYNIVDGLNFSNVEINKVFEKKKEYLCELIRVDDEHLKYLIENDPVFKYTKMHFTIDKEMLLYKLLEESSIVIKDTTFYNTFLIKSFEYDIDGKVYEFIKLSDKELDMNIYFNNELKRYMYKERYDEVITKYNVLFTNKYNQDLFEQIEKEPIITKYKIGNLL